MENSIQFINVTPQELVNLISESVKAHLEQLSINLQSKSSKDETEFLTRKQTAELFGVSLATIHDWNNNGSLKPYKMGNRTYYRRSELLETLYNSNRR